MGSFSSLQEDRFVCICTLQFNRRRPCTNSLIQFIYEISNKITGNAELTFHGKSWWRLQYEFQVIGHYDCYMLKFSQKRLIDAEDCKIV